MRLLSPPDAHSRTGRNAARARACLCVRACTLTAALHSFRGQAELICSAIGNECILLYQHNKMGRGWSWNIRILKKLRNKNEQTRSAVLAPPPLRWLWIVELPAASQPGVAVLLAALPCALELTPAQLCFSRPGWRVGACSQLPANTLLGALSFARSRRGQCQPCFRLDSLDLPACRVKWRTLRAGPLRPSAVFLFYRVSRWVWTQMVTATQVPFLSFFLILQFS